VLYCDHPAAKKREGQRERDYQQRYWDVVPLWCHATLDARMRDGCVYMVISDVVPLWSHALAPLSA